MPLRAWRFADAPSQPQPLQENCWTLNVDRHGGWNVLYDL